MFFLRGVSFFLSNTFSFTLEFVFFPDCLNFPFHKKLVPLFLVFSLVLVEVRYVLFSGPFSASGLIFPARNSPFWPSRTFFGTGMVPRFMSLVGFFFVRRNQGLHPVELRMALAPPPPVLGMRYIVCVFWLTGCFFFFSSSSCLLPLTPEFLRFFRVSWCVPLQPFRPLQQGPLVVPSLVYVPSIALAFLPRNCRFCFISLLWGAVSPAVPLLLANVGIPGFFLAQPLDQFSQPPNVVLPLFFCFDRGPFRLLLPFF